MANSHYLEKDRLAHVIAAIQILGASDQASATLNRWVAELEGSEELTADQIELSPVKFAERKKWATVFEQHPEFFKSYTLRGEQRVLLRWRYAQSFKVKRDGWLDQKVNALADNSLVAAPLSADQIGTLINTAIELEARAEAAKRKPERLHPLAMTAIGAALGTIAGGAVLVLFSWMQTNHVGGLFN